MGRFSTPSRLAPFLFALAAVTSGMLVACGDDSAEDGAATTSSSTSATTGPGGTTGTSSPTASSSGGDGGGGPTTTSDGGGDVGGAGGTGEGGGVPCSGVAECDDDNVCTDDTCDDGFCRNAAVDDGTPVTADGNPCTDDECLGGEETHTAKPAGAPGSDEGEGCAGLCQAAPYDGACGLSLYRKVYPGGDDTWTRDALSSIWTGDGAPPPDAILEAEQTFAQDRLMVWTTDGAFHQRLGGEWSGPIDIADAFDDFPEGVPLAMTVAYQDTFGDTTESLSITTDEDEPRLLVYDLVADGTIVHASGPDPIGNAQLGDAEAPPQHTTPYDWGFARQTAEPFQSDDWIHFDEALGGRIYDLDGSSGGFDFIGSEEEAESDLFAGEGGPAPGTVVAAYWDAESGQVFLVAP
jgi:hypothetical protein